VKRFIVGLVIAEIIAVIVFLLLPKNIENKLLTPLGLQIFEEKEMKMEVVGFLPTWMIGKTKIYTKEIDQLIFSGIEVSADGKLIWDVQSRKIYSDNYLLQKKAITAVGGKNILSIKLFEDAMLDKFMNDSLARENLVREVKKIVDENEFDGVNIDFEYMSNNQRMLDEDFVDFYRQAKAGGWREVGVDVFANTIIKGPGDKIRRLSETVDWVVVMAYDFKRPGSDFAGSVAPIGSDPGSRNISEITDKIVKVGDISSKFIMAYPLYGYEWETNNGEFQSATRADGYGRTVFLSEGIGMTGLKWDEKNLTPWVAWVEKVKKSKVESRKVWKKTTKVTTYYFVEQWHQAYFENEKSLKAKIDLAKNANVGGVGFWALGYEGKTDLIENLTNY
jgi:spore germination protein YaaH